ncbi:hypothetical protein VB776_12540 [Arcicella sp. DC2W]|uniref:ABC transporter permease n=1 Tax=Arcicella gelida TaxID=2984195 RepID=A0ABU5S5M1_9BACT|nr:hypothetical protein [Arcicella sp. DC2W]MEA5403746.1 hypothetical protein [Arcicella sp. DC2W]
MNNFFSYERFSLLVKRQWAENNFILMMGVVVYASIVAVIYSINFDADNHFMLNKGAQTSMFVLGLFAGGTLFTNYIFKDFGNNIQTMSFLMTPASHFEKLCVGLFYSLIAFPIAFLFVFGVVDFAFVALSGNKSNEILYSLIIESYQGYSFFISLWVTLQIFTMLGAVYFGKMSYIKTAFSGFLTIAIFIFIGYLLVKFIIGEDYNIRMSHADRDSLSGTYKFLDNTLKIYIYYLLAPFFAVITYFKLKEKEV